MEKGSPSPSRSPIPAENVYSGRYGTSPPPDARPAILLGRARSGKGQAAKTPQPVRYLFQVTGHGWQCGGPEILKRKNGRLIEEGFCLPCSATQKQPLEEQAEGGAGLVRYIIELQKMVEDVAAGFPSSKKILSGDMRKRQEERVIPDGMDLRKRLSLSFVKKQPPQSRETGIREKARVPGRPSGT